MRVAFPRGSVVPDHARGWGELVYARAGVGRVEVEAATWVLPPDRALWVPPGVRNALTCATDLQLSTLYFPPDGVPALPDRAVVVEVGGLLAACIGRLADNALTPRDWAGADGRILAVVHDELAVADVSALELPMPSDARAVRLARWWLANPGSARSVDSACAKAGASRRTMERRFREETGISLGAWRILARLHHAWVLLGMGESVQHVAAAVGYGTPSAFVHAFRTRFGTTPGAVAAGRR